MSLLRSFFSRCLQVATGLPQLEVPLTRVAFALRVAESNCCAQLSAKKLGFAALDINSLSFFPPAEERKTLFILGKGPTRAKIINRYGKEISSSYSIGINDHNFFDFEPNAESREPDDFGAEDWPTSPPGANGSTKISGMSSTFEEWRMNTWILQKISVADDRGVSVKPVVEARRDLVRIYASVSFMANSPNKLGRNLRIATERIKGTRRPAVLLGSEASVVRMVYLGALAGFQKIVLVGIDLQRKSSAGGGQKSWTHVTARDRGPRSFSVQQILRSIIGELEGVELFVGHKDSLLADFLPVYPWETR